MVQRFTVCLPMQGTGFDPWPRKTPHAVGQLGLCATTTESAHLELVLRNKKCHRNAKPARLNEE